VLELHLAIQRADGVDKVLSLEGKLLLNVLEILLALAVFGPEQLQLFGFLFQLVCAGV
jgi:hypothetical protein